MLDPLHFIRKSSVIAQKKRIDAEQNVPSSQIFLLLLILSILRKTFFLRHFDDVIEIGRVQAFYVLLLLSRNEHFFV